MGDKAVKTTFAVRLKDRNPSLLRRCQCRPSVLVHFTRACLGIFSAVTKAIIFVTSIFDFSYFHTVAWADYSEVQRGDDARDPMVASKRQHDWLDEGVLKGTGDEMNLTTQMRGPKVTVDELAVVQSDNKALGLGDSADQVGSSQIRVACELDDDEAVPVV